MEFERLTARVAALEALCGAVYQFAGEVGAPVRVLDALAAAAQGEPIPDSPILPITADECAAITELQARLDRVRQAVA